ncbi:bifunctional 5,10-methylenetetrahydrofolate dehydrogenase/5,10-methenyltetrahydrofolate cyclohydrolase [Polaromonas sp.]|nr:bifunctional 5,10-methylenetetrahydrofolate dehydrogenase/5,10-methenyltetrahydrofolate cyclohydrolase [Candidatus Saccharibacteria bacterium]
MKILNGKELAEFIAERQAHQVRALVQAHDIQPKLAIIVTIDNPVIDLYMRLKTKYGAELGIEVEIHRVAQMEVPELIEQLNVDETIHGIIIQLPLEDTSQTDDLCNLVDANKDVDALGVNASFDPATPMAIMWLLAGYNIELRGKHILLVGKGKLVGAPLERMLASSGLDVEVADRSTKNLAKVVNEADIIITATGSPAILYAEMLKSGAVVVDAGVASEDGKTVGDVAPDVFTRDDLTITPVKGGVGPLTVCALFDNVIRAARLVVDQREATATDA